MTSENAEEAQSVNQPLAPFTPRVIYMPRLPAPIVIQNKQTSNIQLEPIEILRVLL